MPRPRPPRATPVPAGREVTDQMMPEDAPRAIPSEWKRCSFCGLVRPSADFHRNRTTRDGLQSRCRDCNNASARQFHGDNLEHCRERIRVWIRTVNRRNQARVLEYLLAHPCVDCGESDPIVLEFDHVEAKLHGIAELLHSHVRWARIEAEIAKCEVRCANCHRRKTAERGGWFRHRATTDGP